MIFGIGTDLIDIRRIESALKAQNNVLDKDSFLAENKFAQRILTPYEYQQFQSYAMNSFTNASAYLAKRFAAKEATAKAFGTGFSNGLSLQHIEVRNDDSGKPLLFFYHYAKQFMLEQQIKYAHISLSDEKHYALAYVILSC